MTDGNELGREERFALRGESKTSRPSEKMSLSIRLISGYNCQGVAGPGAAADEACLCLLCGNVINYEIQSFPVSKCRNISYLLPPCP